MVGKDQGAVMSAREDILKRIRAANVGIEVAPVERGYRRRPDLAPSTSDLLQLFTDRLMNYGATVRRCRRDSIAATVGDLLDGAAPVLRAPGIPEGWCPTADADRA